MRGSSIGEGFLKNRNCLRLPRERGAYEVDDNGNCGVASMRKKHKSHCPPSLPDDVPPLTTEGTRVSPQRGHRVSCLVIADTNTRNLPLVAVLWLCGTGYGAHGGTQ